MAAGSMTMACLMLVAGLATPEGYYALNQRDFNIPIRLDAARKAEVSKLILYYSTDKGASWGQASTVEPSQGSFLFSAKTDGVYFFTVCTVDQKGKQDPEDVKQAAVGQKVLVDTLPPLFTKFTAERQGDSINVAWDIREDTPDLKSLRLEYQPMEGGDWQRVEIPLPGLTGQTSFRPATQGALRLRMQVQDLAENQATPATAEVAAAVIQQTTLVAPPPQPSRENEWSVGGGQKPGPVLPPAPQEIVPPSGGASWNTPPPVVSSGNTAGQLLASSQQGLMEGPRAAPGPTTPQPARGVLPPVQMVNNRQVTLEYEVSKYGLSGLGSVELFLTRDDGRNWQRYGGEQVVNLPPPVDGRPGPGPMHQTLTVLLPGEGLYGFYLVAKTASGRGKPGPSPNEAPQMRILVDETPPRVYLYGPVPDPTRQGAVILNWDAMDPNANMTATITLEWAEHKDSTWHPIGGGELANTGHFSWYVPPGSGVPPRVFLRVTARDRAGNVAVAESNEAVLIDLTEPAVNITAVHVGAAQ